MKRLNLVVVVLVLIFSSGCGRLIPRKAADPTAGMSLTITESQLRTLITQTVAPRFPERAPNPSKNVLVIDIHVTDQGILDKAAILQSPSQECSSSILDALKHWKIAKGLVPPDTGIPLAYGGKLTFYFVRDDSGGHIYGPGDHFFIGPQT